MSKMNPPEFPIGCLFVQDTKTSRLIALVDGLAVLRPTGSDAHDNQDFTMTVGEIRENMKRVDFEIKFPTAAYMKGATALRTGGAQYVDLDYEAKQKILFDICSCIALEELAREKVIKITETSIDANFHVVEKRIEELYRKASGTPRRGNAKRVEYVVPAGETLVKQYSTYAADSFDPVDLNTKHSNAGRPRKQFPQWVVDLMHEALEPYMDGRTPKLIRCYEDLKGKILISNRERSTTVPDHTNVKVSERKFREFAKSMDPASVKVSRKGWEELKRTMRSGFGELKARMIAEAIQIDECEMPLWTFLEMTGLDKVVGAKTMRQLKREAEASGVGKIWILVAVDVATGFPLAFHLAQNPNADDTLELLRRLVSDKTQLAREAGCENDPPPPVRPFMIMMDTGSGLWNNTIPHAILSLGAMFRFGRTKSPSDKAFIERFFATLGSDLLKALHGYNGEGPGKQTGYDGQEMAVMSMAQLEKILWWYFTDCLPFKATQRKGAWGGIRHVIFDRIKRMYGMLPALSHREVRRAVGLRVTRKVTKMGVEAFRMPYQGNEAFRQWVLRNIGATLTICVDPNRLEEVTAITKDGQVFYLKACLSQFKHFSLREWRHFLEEWRATDPVTEEIAVEALYRFYNRVRAEMDSLLAFYGKEHKVIKRAEAQHLADTLAGSDMAILHGEDASPSAALSALAEPVGTGEGVYAPGDDVAAQPVEVVEVSAVQDVETNDSDKTPPTKVQKFTGTPEGKGSLK